MHPEPMAPAEREQSLAPEQHRLIDAARSLMAGENEAAWDEFEAANDNASAEDVARAIIAALATSADAQVVLWRADAEHLMQLARFGHQLSCGETLPDDVRQTDIDVLGRVDIALAAPHRAGEPEAPTEAERKAMAGEIRNAIWTFLNRQSSMLMEETDRMTAGIMQLIALASRAGEATEAPRMTVQHEDDIAYYEREVEQAARASLGQNDRAALHAELQRVREVRQVIRSLSAPTQFVGGEAIQPDNPSALIDDIADLLRKNGCGLLGVRLLDARAMLSAAPSRAGEPTTNPVPASSTLVVASRAGEPELKRFNKDDAEAVAYRALRDYGIEKHQADALAEVVVGALHDELAAPSRAGEPSSAAVMAAQQVLAPDEIGMNVRIHLTTGKVADALRAAYAVDRFRAGEATEAAAQAMYALHRATEGGETWDNLGEFPRGYWRRMAAAALSASPAPAGAETAEPETVVAFAGRAAARLQEMAGACKDEDIAESYRIAANEVLREAARAATPMGAKHAD